MLKFLPLLWANLQRKRVRTTLTIASIVVAFLLFGILRALQHALSAGVEFAGQDRLITQNRVAIIQPLPASYLERIRAVEGVKVASSQNWFGGMYQNDRNQITAFAVGADDFLETYPEYIVAPEQQEAWLRNRTGALVGRALATRFGWKVGDKIPLMSNIFTQSNGSNSWDLTIEAIYDNKQEGGENTSLFLHYTYFNESVGEAMSDTIGWVVFRIDDPDRAEAIAKTIDTMFANSPTETKTTTEQAFVQSFANQLGNVGAIVTAVAFAVFFTMLLVTANTMAQSVRERTNELAVMKTLGFSSRSVMLLVLCESLFITALGGLIGLALSALVIAGLATQMQQYMPFSGLPASAYGPGLVLIVVLGLLAGALPCMQAFQLRITEALRRG